MLALEWLGGDIMLSAGAADGLKLWQQSSNSKAVCARSPVWCSSHTDTTTEITAVGTNGALVASGSSDGVVSIVQLEVNELDLTHRGELVSKVQFIAQPPEQVIIGVADDQWQLITSAVCSGAYNSCLCRQHAGCIQLELWTGDHFFIWRVAYMSICVWATHV